MDIQDTDVSEDAPDWFKIKYSRVAKRPMSPNQRILSLPPRGKAECSSKSYVFEQAPPQAVVKRGGKFGTHELMLADTMAKPQARHKDPTTMDARHATALSRTPSTFMRQKGSLQHYLEQAVHNRHILPVQRSHQRLSPLTESLPRALAKSQSANPDEFQKLYGGLNLRSLTRAATASSARRTRAMARSLRIAKAQGSTFGNARPDTTLSMSRAELRALRVEEEAAEFARDMLQARAISRLSPRVTKDQAPGYTPFDAFTTMQARPLSSTATLRSRRNLRGTMRSRMSRSATALPGRGTATRGTSRGGQMNGDGAPPLDASQSILHVVGVQRPATALSLQHPHLRSTHGSRPPRVPYSPISGTASVASRRSAGRFSTAGSAAGSQRSARSIQRRQQQELEAEINETADLIDSFERKQGLHGPGYMTRKELRQKLRGTEEYGLGVDVKRASKDELVAAYKQYQQMVKDGLIDKAEHKRKKTEALSRRLGLSPPVSSTSEQKQSSPPKKLVFNAKGNGGPVQRLTPRSGSKLVTYFDAEAQPEAQPEA